MYSHTTYSFTKNRRLVNWTAVSSTAALHSCVLAAADTRNTQHRLPKRGPGPGVAQPGIGSRGDFDPSGRGGQDRQRDDHLCRGHRRPLAVGMYGATRSKRGGLGRVAGEKISAVLGCDPRSHHLLSRSRYDQRAYPSLSGPWIQSSAQASLRFGLGGRNRRTSPRFLCLFWLPV